MQRSFARYSRRSSNSSLAYSCFAKTANNQCAKHHRNAHPKLKVVYQQLAKALEAGVINYWNSTHTKERYKLERYKAEPYKRSLGVTQCSTCSQSFFLPIMPGRGALALLLLLLLCALLWLAPPAPLLLL
jgi:hypothetical protein